MNPSHERCSVPYSCCKRNSSVLSIFCGRRVLNMSDTQAWHVIYINNCPDAAHRYVKENVMIVVGASLVTIIVLTFINLVTATVVDEINSIRRIYLNIERRAGASRR